MDSYVEGLPEAERQLPEEKESIWSALREVLRHMSSERRRQFCVVLCLMLAGAVAELATIGAAPPFLSLLAGDGNLVRVPVASTVIEATGAASRHQRLLAATALFSLLVVTAGLIRLQLARSTQQFNFQLAHELVVDVQRRLLLQPYTFHLQRNTSSLLAAIQKTELIVFDVIRPLMLAATGAFVAAFIVAALVYVDPVTALAAASVFSTIYFLVSTLIRPMLAQNSKAIATGYDQRFKIIQESFGGIRDVILDGSYATHLRMFELENAQLNRAHARTAFIAAAPRFVIETMGMVAIALIALVASQRPGGFATAMPVLGAIALGAQRLLPLLQQIYSGWSMASGNMSVVGQMSEYFRLRADESQMGEEDAKPLPFNERMTFEKVNFTHRGRRKHVLSEVSLEIRRGARTAITGATGNGKSTFADLLMGLIEPDDGQICVDGQPLTGRKRRCWQKNIAHVPQTIFLADTTIARNIAMSIAHAPPEMKRVVQAAKAAQVHDFIMSLPNGYQTIVGERGIRLSGGERQRLGIARALYKNVPVLVLDEATSALDEITEAAVFDAIGSPDDNDRTIIAIAHRMSTLSRFDTIFRFDDGKVVEATSADAPHTHAEAQIGPR